jgi:hypothetical protein
MKKSSFRKDSIILKTLETLLSKNSCILVFDNSEEILNINSGFKIWEPKCPIILHQKKNNFFELSWNFLSYDMLYDPIGVIF